MLIAFEVQVTQELAELNESDASVASLDQAIDKAETQWRSSARALSKKRSSAAVKLEKAVKKLLNQMNMTDAELTVALSPLNDVSPFGLEDTRFLISTNPGQSPQALQKTASGGELSRISLAIQVATLGRHAVPTVVFDEVDVGIGGSVAQTIGELLRTLGAHTQVLVVTHLGQVAAQGHHHFNVDKQAGVSSIKRLKPEGSVEEVARMLSGTQVTPQSLAHAQEMVNQAKKA
jgi:DNA repair protein RecN (Recombination protein N)